MFQINDYVVDSTNGICKIEDVVTLDYAEDKNKKYFLLLPIKESKSKVFVPVATAETRFRKTLTQEEIADLLNVINDIDSVWVANDKEREKVYKDAVRSCEPKMLIGIIKTLYFRREQRNLEGKKNTAVDDRYFKMAEDILYSEIGFVLKISNDDVKKLIKEKVNEEK